MRNLKINELTVVSGSGLFGGSQEVVVVPVEPKEPTSMSLAGGMLGAVVGGVLGYGTIATNPIAAIPVVHLALNTAIGYVSGALIGGMSDLHRKIVG